jgi:hypothetical protein
MFRETTFGLCHAFALNFKNTGSELKMFAVKSNEQRSFFIQVSYAVARCEAVRARAKKIDFARQPKV